MKVYVLTDGDYSDYRIKAVTTKKSVAKWYKEEMEWTVEEWETENKIPLHATELEVVVTMKDGEVVGQKEYVETILLEGGDARGQECVSRWRLTWDEQIELTVRGVDLERVAKVKSEQVAMLKAEWEVIVAKEKAKTIYFRSKTWNLNTQGTSTNMEAVVLKDEVKEEGEAEQLELEPGLRERMDQWKMMEEE